jgi:hypothetical protein
LQANVELWSRLAHGFLASVNHSRKVGRIVRASGLPGL